jgi:hypothetical protein
MLRESQENGKGKEKASAVDESVCDISVGGVRGGLSLRTPALLT